MIGQENIILLLQIVITICVGAGVKGIISINIHLARLNGKVHELEVNDRHIEKQLEDINDRDNREHHDMRDKIETINQRCINVFKGRE